MSGWKKRLRTRRNRYLCRRSDQRYARGPESFLDFGYFLLQHHPLLLPRSCVIVEMSIHYRPQHTIFIL